MIYVIICTYKYSHICLINWMNNISLVYSYITINSYRISHSPTYPSIRVNLLKTKLVVVSIFASFQLQQARPWNMMCRSMYCNYTCLCNLNTFTILKMIFKMQFLSIFVDRNLYLLKYNEPSKTLFRNNNVWRKCIIFFAFKLCNMRKRLIG